MLDRYVSRLQELADLDEDDYVTGHPYEGRYLVQASAQICIDLANHLIASEGWEPATEFREAFDRLRERGVLEDALAGHLQSLTGLRNRLVHLYDDVDDRLVHRALVRRLADLDAFARAYAGRMAEE